MNQQNADTNATQNLQLFYTPLGGNNTDRIGGNCALLSLGRLIDGQIVGESILIDAGAHPAHWSEEGWQQKLPDLRRSLSPDSPAPVRAIFLTHGHNDHHEAVVHYAAMLGRRLPPVYGSALTLHLLKEDLRDAGIAPARRPELRRLDCDEIEHIGGFNIEPVVMGHSLTGYGYKVSGGGISTFFSSDFKLDQTTLTPATDLPRLARMGQNGEIDYLMIDSTRAQQDGRTIEEATVRQRMLDIARAHPHERLTAVIMGSSAESLARAAWVAAGARRVAVHHGCSIERTLRAMNATGLPLDQLIGSDHLQIVAGTSKFAASMTPSFIFNIMSGAQAEKSSVLARTTFTPRDVIIMSASTMPWNKPKMDRLMESWQHMGVKHIYHEHASGHEQGDGLVELGRLVGSKVGILPLHGSEAQRSACAARFNACAGSAPAYESFNGQTLLLGKDGPRRVALTTPLGEPYLIVPTHGSQQKAPQLIAA